MKIIAGVVVAGVLSLFANTAFAQYSKGDNLVNLGIGVNSYYTGGIPLSGIYEYGVSKVISVGGGIDYLSYHYGVPGSSYGYNASYIAGRASYHFNELFKLNVPQLDLYAGLSLGYRAFSWNDGNGSSLALGGYYGNGTYLGVFAGGRYYFAKHVGGFAELGALGLTNAKIGVSFRF